MKSNTIYSVEVGVKKVKLAAGRLVGCETDVTISWEILKISIALVMVEL